MYPNSLISSPSFGATFWQPYTPADNALDHSESTENSSALGLGYSAELHGSYEEFCESEKFSEYRKAVRDRLDFLISFSKKHGRLNAPETENNLNTLFNHRFNEYHYFGDRVKALDAAIMQFLEAFCSRIRNETINLETRITAIHNLSEDVTLCADGVISNLASAVYALDTAIGGIRGKLWALKEDVIRAVLKEATAEKFQYRSNDAGNEDHLNDAGDEVHYVNTAWNLLADQFGLKQVPDDTSMPEVRDEEFLAKCAAQIKAALTPDRLCVLMAERCQAIFNSRITAGSNPSCGEWSSDIAEKFSAVRDEIVQEFGPEGADALNISSFVELNEDTYAYTLRTNPTLIALDILRTISDLKLVQEESPPRNEGEWVDEDGMRAGLFSYGELTWVTRIFAREAFEEPVWKSKNAVFELITLPALLQWSAAGDNGPRVPPRLAIEQVIRASNVDQLMEMPGDWVKDAQNLELIRR